MLQVELLHLYPEQNAKLHHTQNYELIYSDPPFPVLRRGTPFTAALRFANRPFNETSDFVRLVFNYGEYFYDYFQLCQRQRATRVMQRSH